MNPHYALRLKAAENKAKGKQIVPPANPSLTSPAAPAPSRAPVPISPALNNPIQVDSEETPPLSLHGYNSSDLELNLDDDLSEGRRDDPTEKCDHDSGEKSKKRKRASHKQQEKAKDKGPVEPSGSSKSSPSSLPGLNKWAKSMGRMAREAADKAEQQDDRDRYQRLERLSACREEMREICDSGILPRDQGSLVMNTPARIEEYGAHALIQVGTLLWVLSMKCMSYRWNHMVADKKVKELSAELAERDRMDQVHIEEMQTLAEELQKLKDQLSAAEKAKEVTLLEGQKERFDAGREVGLVEGYKQGLEEGKAGRITLEEHRQAMTSSHVPTVRDFLKSDTFKTAVEIKSANFFTKCYKTCEAQLEKLGGFSESFDGNLQPYPDEPTLEDDEFAALRDEIEPDA
ncbi:UNVERIFIED_CONTAM: hypothetical protein Sindi_2263000 [Sesamum indicum]